MLDGFVKTAAFSPDIAPCDCHGNAEIICGIIRNHTADILVLPHMCITGLEAGDLVYQTTLLESAKKALETILSATSNRVVAVGLPLEYQGKIYNCSAVLADGKIVGVTAQSPDFIEPRTIQLCGKTTLFGSDIIYTCNQNNDFSFGIVMGDMNNADSLARRGANIIIHLADHPEILSDAPTFEQTLKVLSLGSVCACVGVCAGQGQSCTDNIYSSECVITQEGKTLSSGSPETCATIDVQAVKNLRLKRNFVKYTPLAQDRCFFDAPRTKGERLDFVCPDPFGCEEIIKNPEKCNKIFDMQAQALTNRMKRINAKTLIIGISGGLDSTMALLGAYRALKDDPKRIIAVTMPCFGTSLRTKNNAEKLCEALGVTLKRIDIKNAVMTHFSDIGHDPEKADVVYENAQARERTQILMDLANAYGGIVVGTGDLSELSLGFATYNGDHMSMYAINATLPKTLIKASVYAAGELFGGEIGKILKDIADTPVSPELLPLENGDIGQKTEDIVGPYVLHDFFIYYVVKYGFSPSKIFRMAQRAFSETFDREVILSCLTTFYRRFFAQQYKRSCLPEGVQITEISFSPRTSWKMPGDAVAKAWLDEIDKLR